MSTVLLAAQHLYDTLALPNVTGPAPVTPGTSTTTSGSGQGIADAIRNFIAPLFLLAISLTAMKFLMERQLLKFMQFGLIAIGAAAFFYTPGIVPTIATVISNAIGVTK